MTQTKQKKDKTPFSGYNFLKFTILGTLLKEKETGNSFLNTTQLLEKLYENLEYDETKYKKHTRKVLNSTLMRLVRFEDKKGKSYLIKRKRKSKNNRIMNVYAISKNGEKLFKEMRDYGLKAPIKRLLKTKRRIQLRTSTMLGSSYLDNE